MTDAESATIAEADRTIREGIGETEPGGSVGAGTFTVTLPRPGPWRRGEMLPKGRRNIRGTRGYGTVTSPSEEDIEVEIVVSLAHGLAFLRRGGAEGLEPGAC